MSEQPELAERLGDTIVEVMDTPLWAREGDRLARLLAGHDEQELGAVQALLAADIRALSRKDEQEERARTRRKLAPSWHVRVADLLKARPELEPEARELVDRLGVVDAAPGAVVQFNIATDGGTAIGVQHGSVHYHAMPGAGKAEG
ncbi:hypothetical protein Cs7R123_49100 [Catellatospora sp. TT07R-123]|uniref:hypothetical protein n=1 Tax=Catellatospora sp. TT07R-123 TaxID=2733863 RepID=UPI001B1C74BA|nr:hypothetical protein [Catellatospora sp. TT07R-123]GHJ47568.1 hypothetical protein Cs7R123_49100 [Catellatospora sp. TT07R-123]